jgi:pimeloyl-ACP methyl ester carboxylesterase
VTPFYFGSGQRRLFGIYTPGQRGAGRERAVVFCHPWGVEYLRAHRSMRQLATQLTRAGVHVLRFDYFGTGDSGGETCTGDLAGWRADIVAAIEELRDTSGVERVGLLGLRLGATLAAGVAAEHKGEVDSLVLWDPVVSGVEYVREISPNGQSSPGPGRGADQVSGFPLPVALRREMEVLDLIAMAPALPRRTLTVVSQPLPSHEGLKAALAVESVAADRAWRPERSFSVGAIPGNVLRRIVEWYG